MPCPLEEGQLNEGGETATADTQAELAAASREKASITSTTTTTDVSAKKKTVKAPSLTAGTSGGVMVTALEV